MLMHSQYYLCSPSNQMLHDTSFDHADRGKAGQGRRRHKGTLITYQVSAVTFLLLSHNLAQD